MDRARIRVCFADPNGSEPKSPARKPAPWAKVPFEKRYNQMDWLKLTQTHPDLAGALVLPHTFTFKTLFQTLNGPCAVFKVSGLKGQSNKRLMFLNEVRQQTEGSIWTVLKGRVYSISPYMKLHPGGVDMLMKAVGKDCRSLFNKYHAWVNAEFLLEKCLVGILDDGQ